MKGLLNEEVGNSSNIDTCRKSTDFSSFLFSFRSVFTLSLSLSLFSLSSLCLPLSLSLSLSPSQPHVSVPLRPSLTLCSCSFGRFACGSFFLSFRRTHSGLDQSPSPTPLMCDVRVSQLVFRNRFLPSPTSHAYLSFLPLAL